MTTPATLVNGKARDHISVKDRGLHYGDGLFETIAIYNNKPVLWDRHIARLTLGCDRLKIPRPDKSQLFEEASGLLHGIEKGVLKVIYTRGCGERGYQLPKTVEPMRVLQRRSWPEYSQQNKTDGVSIRLCATNLGHNITLAGLKHLNRLEQVMARTEWQDYSQVFEGIMLDLEQNVISGTMSNVFFVQNNTLITPDLTKCGIKGVIRDLVLETLDKLKITHSVRKVGIKELYCADEIFITNSLIGVWPVNQFNEFQYAVGPITKCISKNIGPLLY